MQQFSTQPRLPYFNLALITPNKGFCNLAAFNEISDIQLRAKCILTLPILQFASEQHTTHHSPFGARRFFSHFGSEPLSFPPTTLAGHR
jgi:hypothetical protein